MKVFNLCCTHDHQFEGWFSCAEDFQSQLASALIACPVCASTDISRRPSAPRLHLSGARQPDALPLQTGQAQWLTKVRELIAKTEDVGDAFTEQARRIHYKETPARSIRGVATQAQRDALTEEGIDVIAMPLPEIMKHRLQ